MENIRRFKGKKKREIFEDTMTKYFIQLMKTINLEIQKQSQTPIIQS